MQYTLCKEIVNLVTFVMLKQFMGDVMQSKEIQKQIEHRKQIQVSEKKEKKKKEKQNKKNKTKKKKKKNKQNMKNRAQNLPC